MKLFKKNKKKSDGIVRRNKKGQLLPGSILNPAGAPKRGTSLTEILSNKINADSLATKLIELADKKNLKAIQYIFDRVDGRPAQTIHNINENKTDKEWLELFQDLNQEIKDESATDTETEADS